MLSEICLKCGSRIDSNGNFCQSCGFYIKKGPIEVDVLVFRMDIIGFTNLTERIELFELRSNLSLLFSNLKMIAEKNGGYVNQYIGDEIEIIFGLGKSLDINEFINFLIDVREFFNSDVIRKDIRMKMIGIYERCLVYPLRLGEKSYIIISSELISMINYLKSLISKDEIVLLGEIEKVFPKNLYEKKVVQNIDFYLLKEETLNVTDRILSN
ncbi:MAG: adenylate/guanylate cyclase domain-containing protein [Candidatus Hydrothermales bacterium]